MELLNLAASFVILAGCFWLVYTHKVPTRTGWSIVLGMVALAAVGNMRPNICRDTSQVMLISAMALGVLFAYWRVELKPWLLRRFV